MHRWIEAFDEGSRELVGEWYLQRFVTPTFLRGLLRVCPDSEDVADDDPWLCRGYEIAGVALDVLSRMTYPEFVAIPGAVYALGATAEEFEVQEYGGGPRVVGGHPVPRLTPFVPGVHPPRPQDADDEEEE